MKTVYSSTPDFYYLLCLALLLICNDSPLFPLFSPNSLQFMLPTIVELSENVEMEGKGAHAKGSRPRSAAALGVCGVHSRCRRKAVCVCWGGHQVQESS